MSDDYAAPSFIALALQALDIMRLDGVAPAALAPYQMDIWTNAYGWDGAVPKGWPSVLDYVDIPAGGSDPPVPDLAPGESRALSRDGDGRSTEALRRPDGRIVAMIEGPDASDGVVKSWEFGLEADGYVEFLRELGDRLVTPRSWTHPELYPYVPCRAGIAPANGCGSLRSRTVSIRMGDDRRFAPRTRSRCMGAWGHGGRRTLDQHHPINAVVATWNRTHPSMREADLGERDARLVVGGRWCACVKRVAGDVG